MTTGTTDTRTQSEALTQSPTVRESVDAILKELESKRARITGVRGPNEDLTADYEKLVKRVGEARGRNLMLPYVGSGLGAGPYVELADGSVKLDLTNGIGPNFFGHSDPDLTRVAIQSSMSDMVMQGHLQMNTDALEYTELLVREASRNSRLKHCFLTTSGAMANEMALKCCFWKNSPAQRLVAFEGNFMGRSLPMSLIGDTPAYREGLPNFMQVEYMPFYSEGLAKRYSSGDVSGQTKFIDMSVWHLEQYFDRYPKQHAAFVFELVQGEGGYNTAPREFFTSLMDVCRDRGVAVWIDEIQTFGRTTEMFAFDMLGVGEYVDVVSVGKLTQACATLFTDAYNPKPPLLSGTFLGSTVAVNVGRRMLERLREGGYYGDEGIIAKHFRAFTEHATALAARRPEWFPTTRKVLAPCGGAGGMMRLTPFGGEKQKITEFCQAFFQEGALAINCGHDPYHVRFLPPLGVMKLEEWDTVFEIVERTLAKVAG
jgi:4-aminobutyrate aminotransferase-like enzyme